MATMAQRIQALRDEKGLSRPAMEAALGFAKHTLEKFETGRQTPSKEQQERMAGYFGVSVFYLRGESGDRTRQDAWLDGDFPAGGGPDPVPAPATPKRQTAVPPAAGEGTLFDAFLSSKQFRELLRAAVLDALRSPEGEELLSKAVRKELLKRR